MRGWICVVVACLIYDTLCRDYVRSSHRFTADDCLLLPLMTDFIQYMSLYNYSHSRGVRRSTTTPKLKPFSSHALLITGSHYNVGGGYSGRPVTAALHDSRTRRLLARSPE